MGDEEPQLLVQVSAGGAVLRTLPHLFSQCALEVTKFPPLVTVEAILTPGATYPGLYLTLLTNSFVSFESLPPHSRTYFCPLV